MNTIIHSYATDDSAFSISSCKVKGFISMPQKHTHDKLEIYYLVSGERYYFIKDSVFKVKKGHLIFVNEGEMHKTTDADLPDHERILLYFRKEFLPAPSSSLHTIMNIISKNQYCVIGLSLKDQQSVEKLIHEMYEEITKRQLGYDACLQGLLIRLIVLMGRCIGEIDEKEYISKSPKHEKVSEIVRYINAHYDEALSIPEISEKFFISPYYLSRIFKETTGFTLVEYINSVRVKEAQKLIATKKMKIIHVAEQAGFGSLAQFNRIFKDVTGCSPLNYRKSLDTKKQ